MVEVVVVSSDDGTEADEVKKKKIDGGGASSEVVRWEKYLPKMVLRVLLVEADDSTRQIITALLRKCSYIVAAVPDGLMAWETLKGRPQNIDLILTELDLPSISGFALLTLVMEHEICKNIPVIMMSSQDSVSTVLKCMLRGAADYLIKPVRKNELRNLWQHVWRRHAACAENVHHNLLDSQPNLEATAENSTDSRDNLTSNYKNLNKIGNDAQVKQANGNISLGFESKLMENTKSMKESTMHLDRKEENLDGAAARNTDKSSSREEKIESSNMTMDLIGAFDEQSKHFHGDNHSIDQFDPELELSLKRFSFRRISKDEDEIERQKLCHSNNSAFTICRYDKGKPVVTSSSSSELKKVRSFEMPSATTSSNQENIGSCISGQFGQAKEQQQDPHFMGNPNIRQSIETMNSLRESNTLEIGCQSTCTNSCEDEGIAGESGSRQKWKEEEHVDGFKGSTDLQRVSQREAALTKFRMKRKDRCFEKKVRYESRKKLAEQRPRVKGQFVRAPHVSSNGA